MKSFSRESTGIKILISPSVDHHSMTPTLTGSRGSKKKEKGLTQIELNSPFLDHGESCDGKQHSKSMTPEGRDGRENKQCQILKARNNRNSEKIGIIEEFISGRKYSTGEHQANEKITSTHLKNLHAPPRNTSPKGTISTGPGCFKGTVFPQLDHSTGTRLKGLLLEKGKTAFNTFVKTVSIEEDLGSCSDHSSDSTSHSHLDQEADPKSKEYIGSSNSMIEGSLEDDSKSLDEDLPARLQNFNLHRGFFFKEQFNGVGSNKLQCSFEFTAENSCSRSSFVSLEKIDPSTAVNKEWIHNDYEYPVLNYTVPQLQSS